MTQHRRARRSFHFPISSVGLVMLAGAATSGCGADADSQPPSPGSTEAVPAPRRAPEARGVRIHQPDALTSISTSAKGPRGEVAEIPCATCHEIREAPHELPDSAAELGGPHAGLDFDHGNLECASCHDPERYDRLRLANGERIPLTAAMRLCAQCHGPQKRDYDHASHGGMRGHWDLASGPRIRNHCVDCHDPHAPAFPSYEPVLPPRDRFLNSTGDDHE